MKTTQQEKILSLLLEKLSKPLLSKILQEHLAVSKATSYKIINHSSDLSYDAMVQLMTHSHIRAILQDRQSIRDANIVEWQYRILEHPKENTVSYLTTLLELLKQLDPSETKITLTSYENPIFYYMYYPELFAFKLYCWSKTIWSNTDLYSDEFKPREILTEQVSFLIKEICDRFNLILSEEYWTESFLDNTIRQISYFHDTYMINSRDLIFSLINNLYELIKTLRIIAQDGKKLLADKISKGAATNIFKNEIYYTNNIVVIESRMHNMVFSAFDNPNFMFTTDIRIKDRALEWLKTMHTHCTSLTHSNEIKRNEFFGALEQQVDSLDLKIKM